MRPRRRRWGPLCSGPTPASGPCDGPWASGLLTGPGHGPPGSSGPGEPPGLTASCLTAFLGFCCCPPSLGPGAKSTSFLFSPRRHRRPLGRDRPLKREPRSRGPSSSSDSEAPSQSWGPPSAAPGAGPRLPARFFCCTILWMSSLLQVPPRARLPLQSWPGDSRRRLELRVSTRRARPPGSVWLLGAWVLRSRGRDRAGSARPFLLGLRRLALEPLPGLLAVLTVSSSFWNNLNRFPLLCWPAKLAPSASEGAGPRERVLGLGPAA